MNPTATAANCKGDSDSCVIFWNFTVYLKAEKVSDEELLLFNDVMIPLKNDKNLFNDNSIAYN